MIGKTFGHYRIIEKIGAGGMGEVYRARDSRLERDVALKFLHVAALGDEAARHRFRKEALALACLNHPNIGMIFDFGSEEGADFLVMELVEGQTLFVMVRAGPLSEKESAALGMQVASALEEAHERGIIHRDLKPSNIAVTAKGQAKVLDFGLARLLQSAAGADLTASLTEPHAVAGTVPYMAPEQLRGEPADARSDIWALGAVLYEIATGQRPFPEELAPRIIDAILHRTPVAPRAANPGVSVDFERIILKCLEKEPENRYQSAKELGVDLRRLAMPQPPRYSQPPAGKIMLAVLPFANLSADPEQEYFSDGLTEEMIAQLGSLQPQRLGVIARTSAMRYKKTEKSIDQIGRELGVSYVLEGSVRKAGTRVRITAQLVQVSDQTHLWAENYEREATDILRVQSQVARRIAKSLAVELLPAQKARLAAPRQVNPEAHEAYLKGRMFWNRRGHEDLIRAIQFFQWAIEKDARYALAYTGLADAHINLGWNGYAPAKEAYVEGKKATLKALDLDDGLAEAHTSLAPVLAYLELDWSAAEGKFLRAIELNPSYANAHHWYSFLLASLGQVEKATAEIKRARELDPFAPRINAHVGLMCYLEREYDEALKELRTALELDPAHAITYRYLGSVLVQKGMYAEAIAALLKSADLQEPSAGFDLARTYALAGQRAEAIETLSKLKELAKRNYVNPYFFAYPYTGLGETDEAFVWLEKAIQVRSLWYYELAADPRFDPLRADLRFKALLRGMNLPE
jgi:serine/threonine protein kinase/tetratricopeptide (TPR) repeat protein